MTQSMTAFDYGDKKTDYDDIATVVTAMNPPHSDDEAISFAELALD